MSEQVLLALLKPSESRTNADIEQIASFCRLFSVFNEIPEHTYNSFCRILEIEEFDPGQVIYHEGDVGSDWYILVDGSVNVEANANSTTPIRGIMKIGDSFGRSALSQDVVRAETVTAITHVYVLRVSRRQYQEMLQQAQSGLDGEGQAFASEFIQNLAETPGMHIATSICRRVFPTNSVVIKQGENPDGTYYIIHGSAAVVREIQFPPKKKPIIPGGEQTLIVPKTVKRTGPSPQKSTSPFSSPSKSQPETISRLIEIDELSAGAIFGLRSLCLDRPENVSIIAKCELTTFFLSRSDFYRKVDVQKQKQTLPPDYPDDAQIRKLFQKQMQWERYKKKVVSEVLARKKEQRPRYYPKQKRLYHPGGLKQ